VSERRVKSDDATGVVPEATAEIMKRPRPSEGESLREAVAARALSPGDDPALEQVAQRLADTAGGGLDGLVFFGSRRTGAARANVWSAYDVFVIVARYRPFYEAMRRAGQSGKGARLLSLASRWLPPTQYSIRVEGSPVHVKASVIRTDTFHRETSPRRRDHFCIGRLFQPSRILYAKDDVTRAALVDDLVSAHEATWQWSRPWLPPAFDADGYGGNALKVSMSWEVRPEPPGRAEALWEAQRKEQGPVFEALLSELAARGELVPATGAEGFWGPARPVSARETFRLKLYFRRSIARSTTRWLKHVVSFEGWLDYILRKANRHGGEPLELSERERRLPLIYLWPRVFRYLRARNRKGSTP
jgi:hypothetical protein